MTHTRKVRGDLHSPQAQTAGKRGGSHITPVEAGKGSPSNSGTEFGNPKVFKLVKWYQQPSVKGTSLPVPITDKECILLIELSTRANLQSYSLKRAKLTLEHRSSAPSLSTKGRQNNRSDRWTAVWK